ncbi:MAG TPA: sugar phosphate isomerase/epimerase [Flavitalea sp.]|nr:sugar phosphate isomerase/epimerase [Flavitalea sp.]
MTSRRNFLRNAGAGAFAATISPLISNAGAAEAAESAAAKPDLFTLGIAGYTFYGYKDDLDKTIDVIKAVGVKEVSLKNFQLPYDSTQDQADRVLAKFNAAGIAVYGVGVVSMKNEKEVNEAFPYAQKAKVKVIIAAPSYEMLPLVAQKAKEYNIRVAIHNHGPEDKIFPDIDVIYEKIKDLDPLVGICLDIGHSYRNGNDPTAMLLKYKSRIYDMHIKDVDRPVAEGKTVVNGHGGIDFVRLIKALRKAKYSGSCSLEYEYPEPALGVAESLGHFRGVLAAVK